VSLPDFDQMTKEEIIEWFDTTEDHSALLATMQPSTAPVEPPGPDGYPLLLSVRIPIPLVEKVEAIAQAQGVSRSEVIRDALAAYVKEKTAPVGQDEAEHALDVLRRVVENRRAA
jgi:predicted transcriptional regulator